MQFLIYEVVIEHTDGADDDVDIETFVIVTVKIYSFIIKRARISRLNVCLIKF